MNQALQVIETPAVLPLGVTRKQWRLAALLPRCETAYEALIKAGYKPETARTQSSRTSLTVGVQRASEAIAQGKLDNAREVKKVSASRVLSEVKRSDVDPNFALSAWATASKIESEYPDAENGVGDAELAAAQQYIYKVIHLATEALIRKYSLHNIDASTALSVEDVESIALAAQTA